MKNEKGFVVLGLLLAPIALHAAVSIGAGVLLLVGPAIGLP